MVNSEHRGILLASGSPRRADLLTQLGFAPQVLVPRIPEIRGSDEMPAAYTRRLAASKAAAAADLAEPSAPAWVLAADTIVVLDREVLEKPRDAADAEAMLRTLSGRTHTVITSFCWLNRTSGQSDVRSVETDVEFRELTDELIERYVATGEPMDKAGAYGIQGIGAAFCRVVHGSYSSVVGLPVCEVIAALEELGGLTDFPFAP